MHKALHVVQQAYEAYGRRDVPAILELVALEVDWEFVGSASLPYAGRRQTRDEVADFFAMLARTEDFHVFEPREFIEADGNVTVLGWAKATGLDTQKMSRVSGLRYLPSGRVKSPAGVALPRACTCLSGP